MGFKKGEEWNGNSKGRTKGSQNKTTKEVKEILNRVVSNQLDDLEKDIKKLKKIDPVAAMKMSIKLLDYVIPKMNKLELTGELRHKIDKIKIEIKNGNTDTNDKDV